MGSHTCEISHDELCNFLWVVNAKHIINSTVTDD